MKDYYLFDFDGTLVDSMPTFVSVMLRILDENNIPYEEDIIKVITPLGLNGTAEYYINDLGLNFDFYATRARGEDEILPWDMIDIGVRKDYLLAGWHDALKGVAWPDCREKCANCGARCLTDGVCNPN